MPKASRFQKKSVAAHAALAWDLVTLLDLNGPIQLGDTTHPRFSLVDAKGYAKKTPAKAVCLFDMQQGKAFLPQTDSEWLDQLMTRFRVSVAWSEEAGAWEARTPGETPITGLGQTPGVAVVEALVAAGRQGLVPTKHPYPGSE